MGSRRTQPYRAMGRRHESPALAAMQRGGSPLMRSPGDVRKQAMKRNPTHKSRGSKGTAAPLMKVLMTRKRLSR